MANLNLSEFGEKLFVADADHTFIWDTVGAISKRVSRNSWLNSGTLTSDAPVTISQTWNAVGQTFKALVVNAAGTSDANSASASKLLELQIGGVSKFSVDKYGITTSFGAFRQTSTGAGINVSANGSRLALLSDNAEVAYLNGLTFILHASAGFGWASGAASSGSFDTILLRDGAANTLALRNGAGVPQTFRVYNTFLGTTANEWFEIDWKTSPGTVRLFTMHGGTGVARNIDISAGGTLYFGAGTSSPIRMYSNGVERWNISAAGHFIAAADNQYDIGASGANRPRTIYAGTSIFAPTIKASGTGSQSSVEITGAAGTGSIYFYPNSASVTGAITNPSDGVLRISDGAQTSFNRLQFGGTSASYPALKRNSTTLQARLADDSAFAPIQGKLTTDTAYTGTVVAATGYITIYDSTGTAYRVPCAV